MLSAHEMPPRRICWSMAVAAVVAISGPALAASGSGAAQQGAVVTPPSAHAVPDDAESRLMVPHVDIADGCEDGRNVTRSETVDAEGHRHIRVRICQAQIEAQAYRAARAGLIAARAQIAAAAKMSDKIRAGVLRDLDKEIARMDGRE